jgi:hypothetical protein
MPGTEPDAEVRGTVGGDSNIQRLNRKCHDRLQLDSKIRVIGRSDALESEGETKAGLETAKNSAKTREKSVNQCENMLHTT